MRDCALTELVTAEDVSVAWAIIKIRGTLRAMTDAIRAASLPLPKRCIFCQSRTKLIREDFSPKWFRELYPAPPLNEAARLKAEVSWHERDTATGEIATVVAPSKLARPGDLADQTLRIACADCNSGWMSSL